MVKKITSMFCSLLLYLGQAPLLKPACIAGLHTMTVHPLVKISPRSENDTHVSTLDNGVASNKRVDTFVWTQGQWEYLPQINKGTHTFKFEVTNWYYSTLQNKRSLNKKSFIVRLHYYGFNWPPVSIVHFPQFQFDIIHIYCTDTEQVLLFLAFACMETL